MSLVNNIVAFWKLDEGAPSDFSVRNTYADATGRGNTLTVNPDQRCANSSLVFRMGANATGGQTIDGSLAQWGKWNRALTSAEKTALAGGETWPFSTTTTLQDAVAYFLLDEAANASSYADATGRGNDLGRSGSTTQGTGPGGSGHAVGLTGGSFLTVAATADLKTGNAPFTIAGWFKLTTKPSNSQAVLWGQVDISGSPSTGAVVYYQTQSSQDQVNIDLGNGINLYGNGVLPIVSSAATTGTWYFMLFEFDPVTSVMSAAINNGSASSWPRNIQPASVAAKINDGAEFSAVFQYANTTSPGWDAAVIASAQAANSSDVTFGNNSKTAWFWFKASNTSATQSLAGFYDQSNSHIDWLVQLAGNNLYFLMGNNAGSFQFCNVGFSDTSSFHLIVVWFDSATQTLHLDLDHGASTASHTLSGLTPAASTDPMFVGCNKNSGNPAGAAQQYLGIIDEFGIGNGAATSSDLDDLWNGGNGFTYATDVTIDPGSVASNQAIGTTYITVPGIGPASVASGRAIGSPALAGGTVTMSPGIVPSPRSIWAPGVVGPIYPGAVPSKQAFGTVFLDAEQNVSPTAIASLQAFGSPTLNFTKSIAPAAVPSQQAFGTPVVTGGPHPMLPGFVPSKQAFGLPTLTGGNGTLSVYVGGSIWGGQVMAAGLNDTGSPTSYESANPPTITSQTLGRWTLAIDLFDDTNSFAPARGQTIIVMENGVKLFAGCIQTVGRARLMGTAQSIVYHVQATDKSGICDRRRIKTTTYPAGNDVAATILDIVKNYLNGEGIITTPQSVPATGLGALTSSLPFNYDTVTSGFDQIATLSGTIWYVDSNGVLFFNSFTSLPASPWGLVDNPNPSNYRGLLVEETNLDYANTIYAVSNLSVLPGSGTGGGGGAGSATGTNTETFVMTPGNIGVQTLGDGTTVYGINTTQPIGTVYSLTVNGVAQVFVEYSAWTGQQPTSSPQFGPWFWLTNATGVSASLIGAGGLPSGSTVVINYTPYTTNAQATVGQSLQPVDPATGGTLGTCGSGVYELAIQVKNISSVADLNAIAAAELARRGSLPIKITFQTDKPGLAPGQILNANCPSLFLNNVNFLITTAQGVAQMGPLAFGSRFQWKIEAVTNRDPGNFVQWYANLLKNAANALPVYQYEDASFVLAPGTSLAGGNPTTNPYLVKRTGQITVIYAAAAVPPTNQNLVIFFYINGIRLPGQVVIPAGSPANTAYAYEFPTTSPYFVFNTSTQNDVVTIGVSYQVTGSNPTPASNVSASLRWRM